jgi:type I restriction enzyme S subunit
MKDWVTKTISECCEILDNKRIPLNEETRAKIPGTIPYYGANGVQGYIDKYLFDEDLILIAEDGGYFDEYATRPIAYRVSGKSWVNNHAHVLRAKAEYDQSYIFYSLVHKNILKFILGGTRAKLNQSELRSIEISLPTRKPEQSAIARILSTVDKAIEKTEQLIAKYERIKTGLMQDLLTKGIDEQGRIRSESTHRFKDSPLGRIPVEWEVGTLGHFCLKGHGSIQTGPFGSQLHAKDYVEEGTPIITVEHLTDNRISHSNLPLVSNQDYERLNRYVLRDGDLVFSRVGAIDRCSIVTDEEDGWLFSGRCLRVRPGKLFEPFFLLYQLNFYRATDWILANAVGSTMKCLNTSILSSLPVFKPHVTEQRVIAERIMKVERLAEDQSRKLINLKSVKSGLLQDLLSGRVRVPEEMIEQMQKETEMAPR